MTAHKMLDEKFYSKSLGEELDLIICLPPDFRHFTNIHFLLYKMEKIIFSLANLRATPKN